MFRKHLETMHKTMILVEKDPRRDQGNSGKKQRKDSEAVDEPRQQKQQCN